MPYTYHFRTPLGAKIMHGILPMEVSTLDDALREAYTASTEMDIPITVCRESESGAPGYTQVAIVRCLP